MVGTTDLTNKAVSAVRGAIAGAEGTSGMSRRNALNKLADQVNGYIGDSSDPQRVQWLVSSLRDLARATR